jgi:hypothetical protein
MGKVVVVLRGRRSMTKKWLKACRRILPLVSDDCTLVILYGSVQVGVLFLLCLITDRQTQAVIEE